MVLKAATIAAPGHSSTAAEHAPWVKPDVAAGACIVVVPPSLMHRPCQLGQFLLQTGVTHMTSTPRTWRQLCDAWLPGLVPQLSCDSNGNLTITRLQPLNP